MDHSPGILDFTRWLTPEKLGEPIFSQSKSTIVWRNGGTCEVSVQLYVVVRKYTSADNRSIYTNCIH